MLMLALTTQSYRIVNWLRDTSMKPIIFSQILHRPALSSYLVQPRLINSTKRWMGFRTQFVEVRRHHPLIIWKTAILLSLWTGANAGLSYVTHRPLSLPGETAVASISAEPAQALADTPAPAELASSKPATTTSLGTDATGQMLPPITMAGDYAYRNNYSWGQCTWYVAGRRLVPNNWGNADNWYYAARTQGWGTGTIPAKGAIATTTAGAFGHVALVEDISADYTQVYVSEMNYDGGVGIKSFRWAPTTSFRYIY